MIKNGTVFIVGAGASFEARLPLGNKLKSQIAQLTHIPGSDADLPFYSGNDFYEHLSRTARYAPDSTPLTRAFRQLSAGVPYLASIDSFLEIHKDDEHLQFCAKAAIAHQILSAEAGSSLADLNNEKINPEADLRLSDTWFLELAYMLFEKVNRNSVADAFGPVSFIVFNYDRCIEWFLFRAIRGLYYLSDQKARQALSKLRIVHPYGTVGEPSWLGKSGPFFGDNPSTWCLNGVDSINTYSEGCAEEKLTIARQFVKEANTLIFLGLSFHPENLIALNPQGDSKVRRIIGTRRGLSDSAYRDVRSQLLRLFSDKSKAKPDVELADLTCSEFLRQERRAIVLG